MNEYRGTFADDKYTDGFGALLSADNYSSHCFDVRDYDSRVYCHDSKRMVQVK